MINNLEQEIMVDKSSQELADSQSVQKSENKSSLRRKLGPLLARISLISALSGPGIATATSAHAEGNAVKGSADTTLSLDLNKSPEPPLDGDSPFLVEGGLIPNREAEAAALDKPSLMEQITLGPAESALFKDVDLTTGPVEMPLSNYTGTGNGAGTFEKNLAMPGSMLDTKLKGMASTYVDAAIAGYKQTNHIAANESVSIGNFFFLVTNKDDSDHITGDLSFIINVPKDKQPFTVNGLTVTNGTGLFYDAHDNIRYIVLNPRNGKGATDTVGMRVVDDATLAAAQRLKKVGNIDLSVLQKGQIFAGQFDKDGNMMSVLADGTQKDSSGNVIADLALLFDPKTGDPVLTSDQKPALVPTGAPKLAMPQQWNTSYKLESNSSNPDKPAVSVDAKVLDLATKEFATLGSKKVFLVDKAGQEVKLGTLKVTTDTGEIRATDENGHTFVYVTIPASPETKSSNGGATEVPVTVSGGWMYVAAEDKTGGTDIRLLMDPLSSDYQQLQKDEQDAIDKHLNITGNPGLNDPTSSKFNMG